MTTKSQTELQTYFQKFRKNIIGIDQKIRTPYGLKKMIYADWTASARMYKPIEDKITNEIGKYVANTHSETTTTGTIMTLAYHHARDIIKNHVHANDDDLIINAGSGMTGVVNKFQRILGLKIPESLYPYLELPEEKRPVVFVSHMEHHSNHTSWLETICDVEVIPPDENGLVGTEKFAALLDKYKNRELKIATITACSNVTGIQPCCREIARMIHEANGLYFVDYACSAPYVEIDMHPDDPLEAYDAIYFSPHKFLGGPGSPGILIFNKNLYKNKIPDQPGGGTVSWTNAWNERHYFDDPEVREDGGTPPFLQTMKAALAVLLKEEMGTDKMLAREKEMLKIIFLRLKAIPGLHILAHHIEERLGVISFYIENLHYNLGVKLLNDRFGIQTRGGCSCAGTYGHYLLHVSHETSNRITEQIDKGDFSEKPGWIRMSFHPVMTDEEVITICDAIEQVALHHEAWGKDYVYNLHSNEFTHHLLGNNIEKDWVKDLFEK